MTEGRSRILARVTGRRGEISYKKQEGQEISHSREGAQNPHIPALTKSLNCKLSEQTTETGDSFSSKSLP